MNEQEAKLAAEEVVNFVDYCSAAVPIKLENGNWIVKAYEEKTVLYQFEDWKDWQNWKNLL